MSPVVVRRWRAERLLRRDFEALRARVLARVERRLGVASGASAIDLDACYAQAWQGLYTAILQGEQIDNPTGWLVVVTHRRAIDDLRARARARAGSLERASEDPDLAAELDQRARLRHLLEGLRVCLSAREREAAVLCYLQGLTRAQAAVQMGLSESAMRKLMEGRGAGRPGVAQKVGELVRAVGEERWCEQQGSLMRALAYGILDPDGERYPLALQHSRDCAACRAYVAALRGLAAALPPVLLPRGAGSELLARVLGRMPRRAVHLGRLRPHAQAGAQGLRATGAGSGAAGAAGAGGGGWLLAGGSLGAKLTAGCLLALGVGAGCIALPWGTAHDGRRGGDKTPAPSADRAHRASTGVQQALTAATPAQTAARDQAPVAAPAGGSSSPAARAQREFGLEQGGGADAGGQAREGAPGVRPARASSASTRGEAGMAGAAPAGAGAGEPVPAGGQPTASPAAEAQAQREFAPG